MAGYNFSLTTFDPKGKLGQLEHALKAVHKGSTSLGIQGASNAPRNSSAADARSPHRARPAPCAPDASPAPATPQRRMAS